MWFLIPTVKRWAWQLPGDYLLQNPWPRGCGFVVLGKRACLVVVIVAEQWAGLPSTQSVSETFLAQFQLRDTRLKARSQVCQDLSPQKASSLLLRELKEGRDGQQRKACEGDQSCLLAVAHSELEGQSVKVQRKAKILREPFV